MWATYYTDWPIRGQYYMWVRSVLHKVVAVYSAGRGWKSVLSKIDQETPSINIFTYLLLPWTSLLRHGFPSHYPLFLRLQTPLFQLMVPAQTMPGSAHYPAHAEYQRSIRKIKRNWQFKNWGFYQILKYADFSPHCHFDFWEMWLNVLIIMWKENCYNLFPGIDDQENSRRPSSTPSRSSLMKKSFRYRPNRWRFAKKRIGNRYTRSFWNLDNAKSQLSAREH